MDRENFELNKDIIEWLIKNGCSFMESAAIHSYAIGTDKTISESYFELKRDWIEKKE